MTRFAPEWEEHQHRRWLRHDAHRFVRPGYEYLLAPGGIERKSNFAQSHLCARGRLATAAREVEVKSVAEFAAGLRRLRIEMAELRFALAMRRLALRARKYSPDQPRVPAGNPDGGQWTREGDGNAAPTDISASRRGSPSRFGANFSGATFGQLVRLDRAIARTEEALTQIRQRDPNWKPTTESFVTSGSIEGAIAHAEARAEQAEVRLEKLRLGIGGNFGPPLVPSTSRSNFGQVSSRTFDGDAWIKAYRAANNTRDLFDRPTWREDQGTVAVTRIDGRLVFGTSSDTPVYEKADRIAANTWRSTLIQKYPEVMQTDNIGHKPNDALYHAEATVLLRIAKVDRGTLANRVMEIHTDNEMCPFSCPTVLPLLGLELGNPTVIFVGPSGARRTMRNGAWDK